MNDKSISSDLAGDAATCVTIEDGNRVRFGINDRTYDSCVLLAPSDDGPGLDFR